MKLSPQLQSKRKVKKKLYEMKQGAALKIGFLFSHKFL